MDEQNQFFLNTTPGCQTSGIHLKKKAKPEQRSPCSDVSRTELFAASGAELLVGEARAQVDVALVDQHRHLERQLSWRIEGLWARYPSKGRKLHLLVLHMFSQQVHDLLTVAPIQETLQGCSSYVEAAWEDQERGWRGTRSTFSENPHPGEH